MKAIIVPGVTDLNKGDQALVWESHRLVKDTGLYSQIFIVTNGDTEEEKNLLCGQSKEKGYNFLENILKHPRRGSHNQQETIEESKLSLFRQVRNALSDLISRSFLLLICNNQRLVKALYSDEVYDTIRNFNSADAVFVKGGGFIHAYGERTAPYLMWFFLFYVRLAKRLNKKVVFFPNSFGPFEGHTVKKQVRNVLKKVDIIYAREKVSAEKLGDLLNRKIPVEMDLGFFLKSGNEQRTQELLKKYGFSIEDKIVGITIRPWRFPGSDNPKKLFENYINSVESLVNHIVALDYKVAFCNQSLGPNSHEDDRHAIRELIRRCDHASVVWIDENLTCDDLKALYSNFHFFVGTRFHSVIFSMTSLVPSIAIGYGGNKAKGIMGDFNLNDYVTQIEKVSSSQLTSMFDKAMLNYDNIKLKLRENTDKIEESRSRIIEDILSLYNG